MAGDRCKVSLLLSIAGGLLVLLGLGVILILSGAGIALSAVSLVLAVPIAAELSGLVVGLITSTGSGHALEPPRLPRDELDPALAATAVVYPAIVHDSADVADLLESLCEGRSAAGPGFAMHLALVDFSDSAHPTKPSDVGLRAAIEAGVAALNADAQEDPPAAVLFRFRKWNARENAYLGWERKRGKLFELTSLIAGANSTSFDLAGPAARELVERLRNTQYLLTLDVGSRLHAGAARGLVAAIAHPANKAVIDPGTHLAIDGFTFMRPNVVAPRPTTVFAWLQNPYQFPEDQPSHAQATLGKDVFVGQGVFDVAAYRAVLAGAIPEDTVLSHDKLEGAHGRAAAITEARLSDTPIGDYVPFRRREHRWIRGDTHLLPWILPHGRNNIRRLPGVERLMLASDIVGHLYPAAMVGLLLLGWIAAPARLVGWWTLATLVLLAHPLLAACVGAAIPALRRSMPTVRSWRSYRQDSEERPGTVTLVVAVEAARLLLWLAFLLDRALVAVDAVGRAIYRMWIGHRHTLQWTTSARESRNGSGFWVRLKATWLTCLVSALCGLAIAFAGFDRFAWAAPLLALWPATPVLAQVTATPARSARGASPIRYRLRHTPLY